MTVITRNWGATVAVLSTSDALGGSVRSYDARDCHKGHNEVFHQFRLLSDSTNNCSRSPAVARIAVNRLICECIASCSCQTHENGMRAKRAHSKHCLRFADVQTQRLIFFNIAVQCRQSDRSCELVRGPSNRRMNVGAIVGMF